MKIVILIILLLCILFILVYSERTSNYNKSKNLSDSYSFAHFSNINSYNYFLNYAFMF